MQYGSGMTMVVSL